MIAPQPNFLLLKEIRATVLSLDTYIDKKIQLGYDADYRLCSTHHYQSGSMTNAATYRKNTLELLDMVAYRADGQVTQTHAYSYNENGKLLTITGMDAAGVVFFSKNHCYDRNGILTCPSPGISKNEVLKNVRFTEQGNRWDLQEA